VWAVTAAPRTEPDGEAPPAPTPAVRTLIDQGRKIQAIKLYRQLHPGTGLKEAKDIIDGLAARGDVADPGGTKGRLWYVTRHYG
jgi:ribosomal protein L7/L12